MQLCHSFHLPTTRSLFKVDQSSHVQFIDKNILMISNTFIQDAQRAVSVKKRSTYDTGGRSRSEGNVLVRGRPVCDDGWGDNEADVACRFYSLLWIIKQYFSISSKISRLPRRKSDNKLTIWKRPWRRICYGRRPMPGVRRNIQNELKQERSFLT